MSEKSGNQPSSPRTSEIGERQLSHCERVTQALLGILEAETGEYGNLRSALQFKKEGVTKWVRFRESPEAPDHNLEERTVGGSVSYAITNGLKGADYKAWKVDPSADSVIVLIPTENRKLNRNPAPSADYDFLISELPRIFRVAQQNGLVEYPSPYRVTLAAKNQLL